MKYRLLTTEELEFFEDELKQFLIVNGFHDKEWREINKTDKSKKKVFKAETSILRLSNHKSKKFINWHPKWTLDKSLSKIVEWNKQIKFKSYLNVCEDQIKDFLKS